jgi:DNA helicase II / ATP-dependent DNA helicase PcrA
MPEERRRFAISEPLPPADETAPANTAGLAARALAASASRRPYLEGLNAEQRQAVETLDGPVLVLSGAGTGKTRVLTTRIAHIIATARAYPSQILAVTFTNKAAREMKLRVGLLLGEVAEGMPWLGTFHSIATKMLRRHAELVGLRPDFTILDTDDQIRLLKQVIAAENLDEKRWPARHFAHIVDGWKNRGLTPDKVPPGEGMAFGNGKGVKLYGAYQERLATLNAADFGDLLLHVIAIFRAHPDVLALYHERFRFILVDEYQDTNVAQYLWLRLVAQGRRNVCCVGDDDQSIYGWRGAEVDNILRFEHDFPGAKVIRLEQNYRSTGHILGAASGLIAHNQGRLGKTLRTEAEDGAMVTVTGAWDSQEEARLIGDEIEALQSKGHALSEMAVLVRISAQMREFEDRFVNLGLPYRVIGGPRFYERMEIRDALAYFRIVSQPADDLAFERIINTPKRGLAEATLSLLHNHARAARVPLLRAAEALAQSEELKPKPRVSLRDLLIAISGWAERLERGAPHTEVAAQILEESGYTDMWKADRSADAAGRLDNLKELVRSMEEFPDMRAFLEHVALVMEASDGEDEDRVSLMTLHGAKGLEFDTVFLPGWEDGLFPNQRALDENGRAGLEEERRLAYVGITRARRNAKIYFATNRRLHGLWQSTVPSRFIDELPQAHAEVAEGQAGYGPGRHGPSRFDNMPAFAGSTYATPGWKRAQARQRMEGENGAQRAGMRGRGGSASWQGGRLIEGEVLASSIAEGAGFTMGERVFHQKFGPGVVAGIDGNKLTVDFDKAGRKMVLDSFMQKAG